MLVIILATFSRERMFLFAALGLWSMALLMHMAWFTVVFLYFLKYSLAKLMGCILGTAMLFSLATVLEGGFKAFPILTLAIWLPVLYLKILDHDPDRKARFGERSFFWSVTDVPSPTAPPQEQPEP